MSNIFSRRDALKLAVAGLATSTIGCSLNTHNEKPVKHQLLDFPVSDSWSNSHDRIWIGGEYWANPMEDWRIINGAAECLSTGGNRSIHSLTHQLTNSSGVFSTSVRIKKVALGEQDGGAGIRVGVNSDIREYRSNCFVQQGFDAGIIHNHLALGNKRIELLQSLGDAEVELKLSGEPRIGVYALTLEARLVETGQLIGQLDDLVATESIMGNVCVVSNFSLSSEVSANPKGSRYSFSKWIMQGDAFNYAPEQKFGPILWTMYTLNDTRTDEGFVLKLSVLTGPMGENDSKEVELQIQQSGRWESLARAELDPNAWLATFRIAHWNEKEDVSYRVVYREQRRDGGHLPDYFSGTIKANPIGRPLRMAALTCQNDYAFPYAPVANNVVALNPDLILFSGDQIYENHGGFGFIRAPEKPATLNYLRKFYQFGWAFREAMRHSPTICLPDDHDVLQGNLWGEAGAEAPAEAPIAGNVDAWGGYVTPVSVVNLVHKTHTAHLPEPFDPRPINRGISTYYTDLVYGDVSFAILADRQWKSGPEQLNIQVGVTGEGEPPAYINPAYDRPDLQLLGKPQENFLAHWAKDWRHHSLKAVLSQTVFAGISTHQPTPNNYLKYDFDSSGWPASARNRAIAIMRESKALHICGDTHLGSLCQYGVDAQRDSNWAFCTPAIAAGWPRWWRPDDLALNYTSRPSHGLSQTGEYLDSFGNKIYVYAVANPEVGKSANRYIQAHEKGSGFGFILFDTKAKTYTMQAFRFLVNIADNNPANQFPGWPVVIHQEENIGVNKLA
ncbi:alkaline phosphatase D family protein [Cellvibrio sp. ARAG 10.3]|uniref:alkaline phosphatase D family protein n=1 Tax=Cellvibrio sp. ARAG 10.3 TaxID=3451358 RepID=UPI003F47708E